MLLLENWRIKRLTRKLALAMVEQNALQRRLFLVADKDAADLYLASTRRNSKLASKLRRLQATKQKKEKKNETNDRDRI